MAIPYSFFIRDPRSLPTSFLRSHEASIAQTTRLDPHYMDFPLPFILQDDDVIPFKTRWIDDRWDPEWIDNTNVRVRDRPKKATRPKAKRVRGNDEEKQSTSLRQRSLTEEEDGEDDDMEAPQEKDANVFDDYELVIGEDEALEVQNRLHSFTASEMMP